MHVLSRYRFLLSHYTFDEFFWTSGWLWGLIWINLEIQRSFSARNVNRSNISAILNSFDLHNFNLQKHNPKASKINQRNWSLLYSLCDEVMCFHIHYTIQLHNWKFKCLTSISKTKTWNASSMTLELQNLAVQCLRFEDERNLITGGI